MPTPTKFSDLNIKVPTTTFIGDSISIHEIIGTEITICDYSVEKSKFPEKGDGNRLSLQLKVNKVDRLLWSNSLVLRAMILECPKDRLPVTATILKQGKRYIFK